MSIVEYTPHVPRQIIVYTIPRSPQNHEVFMTHRFRPRRNPFLIKRTLWKSNFFKATVSESFCDIHPPSVDDQKDSFVCHISVSFSVNVSASPSHFYQALEFPISNYSLDERSSLMQSNFIHSSNKKHFKISNPPPPPHTSKDRSFRVREYIKVIRIRWSARRSRRDAPKG